MARVSELLPGASRLERFLLWELLGNGTVRGIWPVADGQEPDAYVELHLDGRGRVVGEGVRIGDDVTLDRCVVWPGTSVDRSARNAVLTPEHRIELS